MNVPEFPPPYITEWVNGGGVAINKLTAELLTWLTYFTSDERKDK